MKVRCLVAPLKGGQRIGSLSPDRRNASSDIVAAKAFLFVCRVGLCYTLGRALGNWFAGVVLTVLRGGLEHGFLTVLQ